ncbi:GatB/YqeY domain-containing protein [Patescibacteria group bacterium]|nr:GatB/YqeY domain-containing protein [Patescibacteria group bacterium]
MPVRDQLKADAMSALKNKDSKKAQALRYLVSILDKRELQLPAGSMTEAEMLSVLQKEMKNKEESKAVFEKANRLDLVDEVNYEIGILAAYLPAAASEEEIRKSAEAVKEKVGNNFGLVMKEVMAQFKGRADGAVVSRIVKEIISA